MIPLIIIEGATASGKSEFALQLALHFGTEIISADSRQVYKLLDIGTAKPSSAALNAVKHHLIGIIDPDESFNAGRFVRAASEIIKGLNKKGMIPIVCGGTGLYVKALVEGIFPDNGHNQEIRTELEHQYSAHGLGFLYSELKKTDPESAARISSNDKQRIIRALEVIQKSGTTLSEHWKKQNRSSDFLAYRILLVEDRSKLYAKIDDRVQKMLAAGLLDEIRSILDKGYNWLDPGLKSVGYKEFRPLIDNESTMDFCISKACQHTRNYAKRQVTWYRKYKYHLAGSPSSINIDYVRNAVMRYFGSIFPGN